MSKHRNTEADAIRPDCIIKGVDRWSAQAARTATQAEEGPESGELEVSILNNEKNMEMALKPLFLIQENSDVITPHATVGALHETSLGGPWSARILAWQLMVRL